MRQTKSVPRASASAAHAASPVANAPPLVEEPASWIRPPPRRSKRRSPLSARDISALTDGMIEALTAAGGVNYLLTIAKEDPKTFCALLAKVLPLRLDAKPQTGFILAWQPDTDIPAPAAAPRR